MNKQDDSRSELQKRLAQELADKAKKKAEFEQAERPDGVTDSAYVKDTSLTSSRAWIWLVVVVGVIIVAIFLALNPS